MKNLKKKSLRLDRETVRNLQPDELTRAAGGAATLYCTYICTYDCPTQHCTGLHCTSTCPQ